MAKTQSPLQVDLAAERKNAQDANTEMLNLLKMKLNPESEKDGNKGKGNGEQLAEDDRPQRADHPMPSAFPALTKSQQEGSGINPPAWPTRL